MRIHRANLTVLNSVLLLSVLVQSIQAPWSYARPPQDDVQTVSIDGHEITTKDVVIAGALTHIVLDRAINGISRAYFEIPDETFDKTTAELMSKHAQKVLYLTSFSKDDSFRRLSKLRFRKLYGTHPNARYLEASSPTQMIAKLKALPQDSSFDRIEIDMHGNSGALAFADGTKIATQDHPKFSERENYIDVEELNRAGLKIAAPGADLRVTACNVADDLRASKPIGKDFLSAFGKSLMPNGGHVIATEKSVASLSVGVKIARKVPVFGVMAHAALLAGLAIQSKVPKGFRFRKDAVRIDIPPREPSCAPALIQALQKSLAVEGSE